jgi:hypothetical protein
MYRPTEPALDFLSRAKAVIESAGFAFNVKPQPSGYVGDAA